MSTGTSAADRTLRTYFDAVSTRTTDSLRDAVEAAQPGSPAAAYAAYLHAGARAATDSGHAADPARKAADRTPDGFRFCEGSGPDRACFDYTDITLTDDKVADFKVNGKPISGRLAVGAGGPVRFDGADASATFVAAIEPTESAEVLVAVRITSQGRLALDDLGASYRSPEGAESASTDRLGPAVLDPGSAATYLFAFADAKVGGTVTLSLSSGTVALWAGPSVGR